LENFIALNEHNLFLKRHIGPSSSDIEQMLEVLGEDNLDHLIRKIIPEYIFNPLTSNDKPKTEYEALNRLKEIAKRNLLYKSYIGAGYYSCLTPPVITRNIVENPGWYTPYTPYQPEIAQGRLESLFNFQTLVSDLTGLPIAGASLLDEATAAMEALNLTKNIYSGSSTVFFASENCHPQTLAVLETRCEALGINLLIDKNEKILDQKELMGAILQYPDTYGTINPYLNLTSHVHKLGGLVTLACDPLALTLLESPGTIGADVAVGSMQRFGCSLSYGGPHAAFFATKDEYKRKVPGRIVGLSKDSSGKPAYRLALQTREQHIRRASATSNICTAQALLANIAAMYAIYHGPCGLRSIAESILGKSYFFYKILKDHGYKFKSKNFFDTLTLELEEDEYKKIRKKALAQKINLRYDKAPYILISFDETTSWQNIKDLLQVFLPEDIQVKIPEEEYHDTLEKHLKRTTPYLNHKVFNSYHSETELMRYIKSLEMKDLSLVHTMMPLGSCTMKLNSANQMIPFTWEQFANLHPQVPEDQALGYKELMCELGSYLKKLSGFSHVSFQPNSGAQGELAGLLVIRKYLHTKGETKRNICLIPSSAHGTNPASASVAGFTPVSVQCNPEGGLDHKDLEEKLKIYEGKIAALMITYPSTYGIFEEGVDKCCELVHKAGGQVYLDGANFNAKLGLIQPGKFGADVCHFNLHKTFCIPHGGGGPGAGPIAVADHLAPFLPAHPGSTKEDQEFSLKAVAASEFSSANLYVIPWMFCQTMGMLGLKLSSEVAILNANYIVKRLENHYTLSFRGPSNFVAHECILDINPLTKTSGITVHDIAKRLMDYGFHSPTVSWPIVGSLMIEPTESESKSELDRFCDALISIREEIKKVEEGTWPKENNPLKNAPHTTLSLVEEWDKPYSRREAVFPLEDLEHKKFWPSVGRLDEAFGDRQFCCTL
jgi:glycine dehydrogenase